MGIKVAKKGRGNHFEKGGRTDPLPPPPPKSALGSKRFHNSISIDTGISDFHHMICTSTRFHVPKHKATNTTYRSHKHFNEKQFVDELSKSAVSRGVKYLRNKYCIWGDCGLIYRRGIFK